MIFSKCVFVSCPLFSAKVVPKLLSVKHFFVYVLIFRTISFVIKIIVRPLSPGIYLRRIAVSYSRLWDRGFKFVLKQRLLTLCILTRRKTSNTFLQLIFSQNKVTIDAYGYDIYTRLALSWQAVVILAQVSLLFID